MVSVRVQSEISPLEMIVTSRPDLEFQAMVPDNLERHRVDPEGRLIENPDYLLFDDLILLSGMQREHDTLTAILAAAVGQPQQLDFRHLLATALANPQAVSEAVEGVIGLEREVYGLEPPGARRIAEVLGGLSGLDLANTLISGRLPMSSETVLRWPAPNTLFARDLGVALGDRLLLTYAAETGRRRDMLLSRLVWSYHPMFGGVDIIDIADDGPIRPGEGPSATLEGGDVQVLSPQVVLVGVGLRTTMEAVSRLARRLFEGDVEVVVVCEMPRRRAAMHIDTLFTRIDDDHCLIYPPLFTQPETIGAQVHLISPTKKTRVKGHLLDALREAGISLSPVSCGGDDPVSQAREQWSDGANAFALAPGVIVCYARNERTLIELNRVGYEVIAPETFIRNATLYMAGERRVVIALPGHELVRGRGGPRCLTMPLRRRLHV